jgi:translation initiation factor IF-2
MAKKKPVKLSKKAAKAQNKLSVIGNQLSASKSENNIAVEKKVVEMPAVLTVREFADTLKLPVTQIIASLVKNGVMANINESVDFETMAIIADELGFELTEKKEEKKQPKIEVLKKHLVERPPVVTVMGHVDHGKTKLLDAIRNTDVVSTESGGITQHIGAYQVNVNKDNQKRVITFLDTPGHEAFSAMRAHGANITDVVVLVVAANDGVKPQTIEAAQHAKEAGVPIVIAINKIDLPDADMEKTKRQLADIDLLPEDWGGNTPIIGVSAKMGQNIDELLEMILLVSDLKELKADATIPASGVVIETHMQAGRGPIATILIQEGTLRLGDSLVIGETYGKIRIMENYLAKKIFEAGPSTPVRIAGLQELPKFGDRFNVVSNEKEAKELTQTKTITRKVLSITELSKEIKAGKIKELKIVLKADVAGSLEAIKTSLKNISEEEVQINIIHDGVGDISESDVNMALAAQALVIGFRVKINPQVMNLARQEGIKIQLYDIIYQLLDDLTAALSGLLEPEIIERELGRLKVLAIFKTSRNEQIIGGIVTSGKIVNESMVKIVRNKEVLTEAKITNLQQNKKDVHEVLENFECGMKIETSTKLKTDDVLECFEKQEIIRKLGS